MNENARRWQMWRQEVEQTGDWATAYDHWVHPATRRPLPGGIS